MALTNIKLPRLPVNWQTQPELFKRYWDEAMTNLEKTLNAILDIPALQTAIADANAAAAAANTAAANAQTATDAARKEASIVNSFINNFTTPLISATSTGNVIIATHDRVYGDNALNPTVSVNGATISTGATSGQIVRVFYDQPSRAGGTVTYQFVVDPVSAPVQSGDRHSVGVVIIPASGTDDGEFIRPPGYVYP